MAKEEIMGWVQYVDRIAPCTMRERTIPTWYHLMRTPMFSSGKIKNKNVRNPRWLTRSPSESGISQAGSLMVERRPGYKK